MDPLGLTLLQQLLNNQPGGMNNPPTSDQSQQEDSVSWRRRRRRKGFERKASVDRTPEEMAREQLSLDALMRAKGYAQQVAQTNPASLNYLGATGQGFVQDPLIQQMGQQSHPVQSIIGQILQKFRK